jgi:hypothetical protein
VEHPVRRVVRVALEIVDDQPIRDPEVPDTPLGDVATAGDLIDAPVVRIVPIEDRVRGVAVDIDATTVDSRHV